MIGIKNNYLLLADQVFTSDATLATITGFTQAISASQRMHFRAFILFTVGATGGIRLQMSTPAATTDFIQSLQVNNTVTPTITPVAALTNAVYTNALAVAGNHFLYLEGTVFNGANAGDVALQMAQNTADVLSLTIQAGSFLETTIL